MQDTGIITLSRQILLKAAPGECKLIFEKKRLTVKMKAGPKSTETAPHHAWTGNPRGRVPPRLDGNLTKAKVAHLNALENGARDPLSKKSTPLKI